VNGIEQIIREARIQVCGAGHKTRPGWLQVDCPFCGRGSQKWHFGFNLSKGYANCWRCGPHSLWETFRAFDLPTAGLKEIQFDRKPKRADSGVYTPPKGLETKRPKAHDRYLRRRGFDPAELERLWRIQYTLQTGRLRFRVFIPIISGGENASWTTRAIGQDVEPRYISASPAEEARPRNCLLYGEDYVRQGVIVHEGPTDVWATGPGAVATLGTSYSAAQVDSLAKYPIRVICFDSSTEAQKRAKGLAEKLSVFPGETLVVTLTGKDAASSSKREIAALRRLIA
jgi:hypothetical protein